MTQADAVIVGAGAMGLSCAHHLAAGGLTVHVIERDGVAEATSTCGAGFVAHWAGGYVPQWQQPELACEAYGIEFYTQLHEERPEFPFRRAGSLYLGVTEQGWNDYLQPIADCDQVPGRQVLNAAEAAEVGQIVRREGVVGGVFDPHPVQVVAREAVRALAARLRTAGVRVEERRPATGLIVEGGVVKGVETLHGSLYADVVVLSTAMWTNRLLAPYDVWLPYAPMSALRITTEPLGIPASTPMILVPDVAHAWLREEQCGLLWGCVFEGQHRDAFLDVDPPDRLEQLPMDGLWETQRTGLQLISAIPLLARYRNFTYAQGAPCYTPDLLPLIGSVPGIEGLYVLTGDSEAGITHAPGFGRALADDIIGREPFVGLDRYRVDRFSNMPHTARSVVAEIANLAGSVFGRSA